MPALYSGGVIEANTLPRTWLLSDARNDAVLERALARLPRGSGFIYRHYHLPDGERLHRFRTLSRIARTRGHYVVLADSALTAREWGADGIYGSARSLAPQRAGLIRLATAHDLHEIGLAAAGRADAVLLSPVFPTASHPGAAVLGASAFRLLARQSPLPVVALGGMTAKRARALQWERWAAIDGLS